jgi:hypothetical protein
MCDGLIASAASSKSISPRPDLSYSYIMRQLRQIGDKERVRQFQESFKKAYDEAYIEQVENADDVALLQAIQECKLKPEEIDKTADDIKTEAQVTGELRKLAQAATDLGDPTFAGRAISEIVKFLMRKIPYERRPHSMMSMRQKILELDEYEMASKKSPVTASMGQSITLIKTLLNGKEPAYIRKTLEHIIGNLV